MKIYTTHMLTDYLKDDWIMKLMKETEQPEDVAFRVQQWHKDIEAKRMIYADLYGDLIKADGGKEQTVLDVGGGYTSLTRLLVKKCNYELDDLMAHGEADVLHQIEKSLGRTFLIQEDWYQLHFKNKYDVIIANDIFPDADQRLQMFIEKSLPHCKELRMSITYYNEPRFYLTRRLDDTDIYTFLSYDGRITRSILEMFRERVKGGWDQSVADEMLLQKDSLYWNGRQVMQVTLLGDA